LSKVAGGVGDGTLYADWIKGDFGLHFAWCAAEAGLGLWLGSGRRSRSVFLNSIFMFAFLSGLIFLEPQPKPCGCIGVQQQLATREAAIQDMRWSLGRNGVLIGFAFLALALLPVPAEGDSQRPGEPESEAV
jgi:hypothetical protein